MHSHKILIAVAAAAVLTLGAVLSFLTSRPEAPEIDGLLWPQSKALQAFALEDQNGRAFGLDRLRGHWTLLFFGYTNCPDICPVTLAVLENALTLMRKADADAELPQVVFVSVDPKRDTPEHLGAYVSHFDPSFVGVTGSDANLAAFAGQLGALYVLGDADAEGQYSVDHTAALFLIDPRGHLVALFQAPHAADVLARDIPRIEALKWN